MSRTSVLTSVLVAAAVTLVVSLSVALGLQATSDSPSETKNASATGEQVERGDRAVEGEGRAWPRPSWSSGPPRSRRTRGTPPLPSLPLRLSRRRWWLCRRLPQRFRMPIRPPTCRPRPPMCRPRRPTSPPAPAYVPPQPQVPAVQPEPRLRDKIIERIPIINRFHDPQPMYPTP